jgi:hypothetical protein
MAFALAEAVSFLTPLTNELNANSLSKPNNPKSRICLPIVGKWGLFSVLVGQYTL